MKEINEVIMRLKDYNKIVATEINDTKDRMEDSKDIEIIVLQERDLLRLEKIFKFIEEI